jgi:hypothetical protein
MLIAWIPPLPPVLTAHEDKVVRIGFLLLGVGLFVVAWVLHRRERGRR